MKHNRRPVTDGSSCCRQLKRVISAVPDDRNDLTFNKLRRTDKAVPGTPQARKRRVDVSTVALMGRVIFMCGPAGSGKSTIARQYERQGMIRLSFDQEAWSRGITAMPLPEDIGGEIERLLHARLANLVRAGSDVVLDFSFWSRRVRDEYRKFLKPFGVVPETVYLATDRATVLQRISARAAQGSDDFKLSGELAAFYFDHFEVPTTDEGPLTVIQ